MPISGRRSMTRPVAPFAERLRVARKLIAAGASQLPVHLADQYGAARADARGLHDRIGRLLPILEPDGPWHQRLDPPPSGDVRAYLVAAVLGCLGDVCCHLRRG